VTTPPARAISLSVVGTVAFDDVTTPSGEAHAVLGGSATYFSVAASLFTRVGVVGVVGDDFPESHRARLASRDIDLAGLETAEGRTFHWAGRYEGSMDAATTLATDLNVLATFSPRLSPAHRRAPYVFLANTSPENQASVLDQLEPPAAGATRVVFADTMNLWIETRRTALRAVLERVDGLTINDAEAKALAGERNLVAAGKKLLELGPRFVIVKKGEHGAFLFARDRSFALPAYPLDRVVDPTGAGDAFAGGLMGRLAEGGEGGLGLLGSAGWSASPSGEVTTKAVAEAMVYGTVAASYAVSSFSIDALASVSRPALEARAEELRRFVAI
jgi:sugar/nucleoside kinase (ribokinase family)